MFQETADIIPAKLAGESIAFGIEEEVFAIFPDALMHMHAGAVILEERLGHESGGIAILHRHILADIFVKQGLIGLPGQGIKADAELGLSGSGHLMMMGLDGDTALRHHLGYPGAQVLLAVGGWDREITFLIADTIAQVMAAFVFTGIPDAFFGIDKIIALMAILFEANIFKNEELQFRSKVTGIANAAFFEISFSLLGHIARVSGIAACRSPGP